MATANEVMGMLMPDGGYVLVGEEYEGLTILTDHKISKKEFEEAFAKCDVFLAEKQAQKAAAKAAILDRLGITEEEAKIILG